MVLVQKQPHRLMEQTRALRNKQTHLCQLHLPTTKEARIYNGEKTVSLTSGAGKTGQLRVKQ